MIRAYLISQIYRDCFVIFTFSVWSNNVCICWPPNTFDHIGKWPGFSVLFTSLEVWPSSNSILTSILEYSLWPPDPEIVLSNILLIFLCHFFFSLPPHFFFFSLFYQPNYAHRVCVIIISSRSTLSFSGSLSVMFGQILFPLMNMP